MYRLYICYFRGFFLIPDETTFPPRSLINSVPSSYGPQLRLITVYQQMFDTYGIVITSLYPETLRAAHISTFLVVLYLLSPNAIA